MVCVLIVVAKHLIQGVLVTCLMAVTKYVTEAIVYGRKGVLWLMDPGDRTVRHMVRK